MPDGTAPTAACRRGETVASHTTVLARRTGRRAGRSGRGGAGGGPLVGGGHPPPASVAGRRLISSRHGGRTRGDVGRHPSPCNVGSYRDRPLPQTDLTASSRRADGRRRHATSSAGTRGVTERSRLEELAGVWRGAGHVAHWAGTAALLPPVEHDADTRTSVAYDPRQVTIWMTLAATTSASAARRPPSRIRISRATSSAYRRIDNSRTIGRSDTGGPAAGADRRTGPAPLRRGRAPRTLVTSRRPRSAANDCPLAAMTVSRAPPVMAESTPRPVGGGASYLRKRRLSRRPIWMRADLKSRACCSVR
jgi:hypothetical protein